MAVVADDAWLELSEVLGLTDAGETAYPSLLEAALMLSYRIAGVGLDRELLHAKPELEHHESPFLVQNNALLPLHARVRDGGTAPDADEIRHIDVLLDQCDEVLDGIRRRASENGISIRPTYLPARLRQLIDRLHLVIDFAVVDRRRTNPRPEPCLRGRPAPAPSRTFRKSRLRRPGQAYRNGGMRWTGSPVGAAIAAPHPWHAAWRA